jgi:hypothetical protein
MVDLMTRVMIVMVVADAGAADAGDGDNCE